MAFRSQRVEVVGRREQVEGEPEPDREDENRQQDPKLLAPEPGAESGSELGPNDAADDQEERQHHVDGLVGDRLQYGDVGGDEQRLEQRGANHICVGMPRM